MKRPANSVRGEAQITIEGKTHTIRPSFEALIAAEDDLGSLFAMVERASAGELTIAEITALIWHCLPLDDRPEKSRLGSAILEMGLVAATQPVRTILSQVLQGRS